MHCWKLFIGTEGTKNHPQAKRIFFKIFCGSDAEAMRKHRGSRDAISQQTAFVGVAMLMAAEVKWSIIFFLRKPCGSESNETGKKWRKQNHRFFFFCGSLAEPNCIFANLECGSKMVENYFFAEARRNFRGRPHVRVHFSVLGFRVLSRTYVRKCVRMYVRTHARMHVRTYVRKYVRTYVRTYV